MIETLRGLIQPASLFDPVGVPLGTGVRPFLILFGAIFAVGFILRGLTVFVSRLNPYLKIYLKRLAFALMTFGALEVFYFLIREVRVAYVTENIVFVVMTVLGLLWVLYLVVIVYFLRYKREKTLYMIERERKEYLPKRKR
jgi:hypothetical protein